MNEGTTPWWPCHCTRCADPLAPGSLCDTGCCCETGPPGWPVTPPDRRWAVVRGGLAHQAGDLPDTIRLTIEVTYGRRILGRSYVFSEALRTRAYVDPLMGVLDGIVESIDDALERGD